MCVCVCVAPDVDGDIGEVLTVEDVIVKLSIQPLKFDGK